MEATTAPRQEWTFAQWAVVIVISLQLVWALAGLIAEPSIDFGEDAATRRVLGVDFNGVHALSGLLLFLPGYYFATRAKWAINYSIYVAGALWISGIWAFFDNQPAYVFNFPNNEADAYFHLATGTLFALIAATQLARDRGRLIRKGPARARAWGRDSPRDARKHRWCRLHAGPGRGSRRS